MTEKELAILLRVDANTKQGKAALKEVNRIMGNLGDNANTSDSKFSKFGKTVNDVGGRLLGGVLVGGVAAAAAGIAVGVKNLAEFDDVMVGVKKTTGLSSEAISGLGDSLREMASAGGALSGTTAVQLGEISEVAGQLGIKGEENILAFTESIAEMTIATGLSANEAATGMAQIEQVFKKSLEAAGVSAAAQTANIGSAFNALENSTTATTGALINMTSRMGGAASTLGLTVDEVAGIGATLYDQGVSIEVAGTAMSKFFLDMMKNSGNWAKAMKLDSKAFSEALKKDPSEAVTMVAEEMQKLSEQEGPEELVAVLDDLGVKDTRLLDAMLKLANGADELEQHMQTANDAFEEGTGLHEEAAVAAESSAQQYALLKERMTEASRGVGELFEPMTTAALKFANAGLGKAIEVLQELKTNGEEVGNAFGESFGIDDLGTRFKNTSDAITGTLEELSIDAGAFGKEFKTALIDSAANAFAPFKTEAQNAVTGITTAIEGVQPDFSSITSGLQNTLESAKTLDYSVLFAGISPAADSAANAFDSLTTGAKSAITDITTSFEGSPFEPFVNAAGAAAQSVIGQYGQIAETSALTIAAIANGDIAGAYETAFTGTTELIAGKLNDAAKLFEGFSPDFSGILSNASENFSSLSTMISGHFAEMEKSPQGFKNAVVASLTDISQITSDSVEEMGGAVKDTFLYLIENPTVLTDAYKLAWEQIKGITAATWGAIKTTVDIGWDTVKMTFADVAGIFSPFIDTAKKTVEGIKEIFGALWEGLKDGPKELLYAFDGLRDGVAEELSGMLDAIPAPVKKLLGIEGGGLEMSLEVATAVEGLSRFTEGIHETNDKLKTFGVASKDVKADAKAFAEELKAFEEGKGDVEALQQAFSNLQASTSAFPEMQGGIRTAQQAMESLTASFTDGTQELFNMEQQATGNTTFPEMVAGMKESQNASEQLNALFQKVTGELKTQEDAYKAAKQAGKDADKAKKQAIADITAEIQRLDGQVSQTFGSERDAIEASIKSLERQKKAIEASSTSQGDSLDRIKAKIDEEKEKLKEVEAAVKEVEAAEEERLKAAEWLAQQQQKSADAMQRHLKEEKEKNREIQQAERERARESIQFLNGLSEGAKERLFNEEDVIAALEKQGIVLNDLQQHEVLNLQRANQKKEALEQQTEELEKQLMTTAELGQALADNLGSLSGSIGQLGGILNIDTGGIAGILNDIQGYAQIPGILGSVKDSIGGLMGSLGNLGGIGSTLSGILGGGGGLSGIVGGLGGALGGLAAAAGPVALAGGAIFAAWKGIGALFADHKSQGAQATEAWQDYVASTVSGGTQISSAIGAARDAMDFGDQMGQFTAETQRLWDLFANQNLAGGIAGTNTALERMEEVMQQAGVSIEKIPQVAVQTLQSFQDMGLTGEEMAAKLSEMLGLTSSEASELAAVMSKVSSGMTEVQAKFEGAGQEGESIGGVFADQSAKARTLGADVSQLSNNMDVLTGKLTNTSAVGGQTAGVFGAGNAAAMRLDATVTGLSANVGTLAGQLTGAGTETLSASGLFVEAGGSADILQGQMAPLTSGMAAFRYETYIAVEKLKQLKMEMSSGMPSGGGVPAYAFGGKIGASGLAIVGDKFGPEIAQTPHGSWGFVGTEGPELRAFPTGTQIIPNRRIGAFLRRNPGVPAFAEGGTVQGMLGGTIIQKLEVNAYVTGNTIDKGVDLNQLTTDISRRLAPKIREVVRNL